MKYVEWVEPGQHPDGQQFVERCRVTIPEAIETSRKVASLHHIFDASDENLLEQFLIVHWARIVDVPADLFPADAWTIFSPWLFSLSKPICPSSPVSFASSAWALPSEHLLSRF